MSVSARFDEETNAILEKTARLLKTSKSEVLRRSIRDFCNKILDGQSKRPYELIADLIGKEESGKGDLSIRGEEILRDRLGRKR